MSGSYNAVKRRGCIYWDTSAKGRNKRHNIWRADVVIRGVRYRKRSSCRGVLVRFLRELGLYPE
jgi:hypothetical protein